MIRRRTVLLGAIGSAIGLSALRLAVVEPEAAIVTIIRRQLGYLKLDAAEVEQYAHDAVASGRTSRTKLRLIAALSPVYRLLPSGGSGPDAVRHGEERVVTEFLLSSDFFQNGADVVRPVRYLGLYDPFKPGNACRNPFSRNTVDAA